MNVRNKLLTLANESAMSVKECERKTVSLLCQSKSVKENSQKFEVVIFKFNTAKANGKHFKGRAKFFFNVRMLEH